MSNNEFHALAVEAVRNHLLETHAENSEVSIIYTMRIFENYKALLSTDGMCYIVSYDGSAKELHFKAYKQIATKHIYVG